jgi:hypothetical protein
MPEANKVCAPACLDVPPKVQRFGSRLSKDQTTDFRPCKSADSEDSLG